MIVWGGQSAVKIGLQWGRVLVNAECYSVADVQALLEALQWGRVLVNAE